MQSPLLLLMLMMMYCRVVPGPPKALSVAVVGATHFMMEWIPPDEPNGEIVGYHFSYQSSMSSSLSSLIATASFL